MHFSRKRITSLIAIFLASLVANSFGEPRASTENPTASNSDEVVLQSSSPPKAPNPTSELKTSSRNEIGRVSVRWCDPPNNEIVIKFVKTSLRDDRSLECQPIAGKDEKFSAEVILQTSTLCRFSLRKMNARKKWNSERVQNDNSEETFIGLNIPSIVKDTEDSVLVIVIGSTFEIEPLPEHVRKLLNMTDSREGWIAADLKILDNKPTDSSIHKYPTADSPRNCLLKSTGDYDIAVAMVNVVDNEPLPIALRETAVKENERSDGWKILSIFLILVICSLLIFIWRRKLWKALKIVNRQNLILYSQAIVNFAKTKTTCTSRQQRPSTTGDCDDGPSEVISSYELAELNCYSRPVDVKDFENYVRQSIANKVLKSQFMMLPRGLVKQSEYGSLPENKSKNRYQNIIAYDDTRVILEKIPGRPYSDYINASYVPGFGEVERYIAAQGPKPETIIDFWRMVWQEESMVICMLANIVEGTKSKCAQYWPNFGETETYGDIVVVTESTLVFTNYTSRSFRVIRQEKTRRIEHLHFTSWPDHKVPRYSNSVTAYLRKLQTLPIGGGPVIVHCSAGVGRTGTIILCDICSRQALANGSIDVLAEFKKLRDCRLNMVDTEMQYLLAHLVLAELSASIPTALPCDQSLPQMIEGLKEDLPQHIDRLHNTVWQDQVLHPLESSRPPLPEQLAKNRFPELAPGSSSRLVYLERYPRRDSNSDYISAVIVDGLKTKMQYLASQLPLPSTLSDFWRLVAEQRVEFVIILQQPDPDDPTCCDIIPSEEPLTPVPFLSVELSTCSRHVRSPKIEQLLLTDTSEEEPRIQEITVLTCTEWGVGKGGRPPSPAGLVELWMTSEAIYREKGPTLVLCHDGVTGCGLYLGLSFLMEQMAVERECDVIFAVRAVRRSRPEFVRSQEQFEYLYDAAAKYVEHFETYANFY